MSHAVPAGDLAEALAGLTYEQLQVRKGEIVKRMGEIEIVEPKSLKKKPIATKKHARAAVKAKPPHAASINEPKSHNTLLIPFESKTDVHWDFVMKEMMWLAADFQGERNRQLGLGKKVSSGIKQYHKTKETRRVRELAEAELKRRRLAAKVGREVKGWWTKIERVIAYKQKVDADKERQKAMNKQLVALVKQTERYGQTLSQIRDSDESSIEESETNGRRKRRRRRKRSKMTIEEALSAADKSESRRRRTPSDYSRVELDESDVELYGESTTEDSGSDGSFVPGREYNDDETTLREAEEFETERRRQFQDEDDDKSYVADPEEIQKLQEEGEMDIELVMDRLRKEAEEQDDAMEVDEIDMSHYDREETEGAKRVSFDLKPQRVSVQPVPALTARTDPDPGGDADDDADASDVEDFVDDAASVGSDDDKPTRPSRDSYGNIFNTDDVRDEDEFSPDHLETDDETTLEAEERLGREMSAEQEISLLQRDGEIPVEQLKAMHTVMMQAEAGESSDENGEALFSADDAREEDEFAPSGETEVDDETTIEAEERLGREMSAEQEISLLEKESVIPIEQLRAMHAAMAEAEAAGNSSNEDMESPIGQPLNVQGSVEQLFESGVNDDAEAEEYRPGERPEVDDETTIAAEEKLGRDVSYEEEIALLKRESEMSVDDLRKLYAGMQDGSLGEDEDEAMFSDSYAEVDDDDGSEEFVGDEHVVDDETTIEVEERLGRDMSAADEIALLQKENEMPIEMLRELYANVDGDSEDETENGDGSKRKLVKAQQSSSKRQRVGYSSASASEDEGLAALQALRESEERARTTQVSRPFILSPWVKLREYQQIGLNWLVSIHGRRLNGILADEMGLGKTLQTISLLAYLAAYNGIWGPHLIVVPTSCIVNWETELKRFCPGLKILTYYGSAKRRKELRTGWTKTNWYHIVVTSYQLVVQDSFAFKRKKWYYMILDEAHNIKNFQSQRWQTLINFNTQRRLLLTGTPLQNNLTELWSLLHFLMPHVFRSRKEFSYWFSNPMNNIIEGNAQRNDELISRLHAIIRPFVLRRLKKDVETQMPGKFEHVVKCQMSRRQMFLYEEFMARSSTRSALRKGGNFMGMMNVLMQLRKVCNHPDLFEPRSVITPLAMAGVDFRVPQVAIGTLQDDPVLDCLAAYRLCPLWCGSSGLPVPETICYHDSLEAEQLARLCISSDVFAKYVDSGTKEPLPLRGMDDGLSKYLKSIWNKERQGREETKKFQSSINMLRCQSSAFPYSTRLVSIVKLEPLPLDRREPEELSGTSIISTPLELLAMRRSQVEVADDLDGLMKKFVFCVPLAGAPRPRIDGGIVDRATESFQSDLNSMLLEPVEEYLRPFRKAKARLSSFFPDKKLVQYDAGKLQTLAVLLRNLKLGGHRALIFTQMSKMLDVLEAFLNLNGHTYVRLDGGTGIERRQRLMDRFNMDEKIFCFILSTRSGGLGINLTGADTVIFYDSDWNPAMDAQAQDRAHRIGQTRDVHIYRLITEHSIEENIWTKAKQKRNLDLIVMAEGKFDAGQSRAKEEAEDKTEENVQDVYSKGGLREILGVGEEASAGVIEDSDKAEQAPTKEQMEKTMAALEDEDDAAALRGAQKEAEDDLKEFDESVEYQNEGAEDGDGGEEKKSAEPEISEPKTEEETKQAQEDDMVKEFETWQSSVGMDASAIESSLCPTEKYGLKFRENIDPFWSIFAIMEEKRRLEATADDDDIDVEELEKQKVRDEQQAFHDGDLLGTRPPSESLPRQRRMYLREKARLRANKKLRKLTGENWVVKTDGTTQLDFWYNEDTGEARWDEPKLLVELRAVAVAREKKWSALPVKSLVKVMEYLVSSPERTTCAQVCRQWKSAATDVSFIRHVLPVEFGSLAQDPKHRLHNHYRTIDEALAVAQPGDTIELGDGHYWVNDPGLTIDFPLKFVGDEHDASHVVIELSGSIQWRAKGGFVEGITFRRPKIASAGARSEILRVENGGRVDIVHSILNNEGSPKSCAILTGAGLKGKWLDVHIAGSGSAGVIIDSGADLELSQCSVSDNEGPGLFCRGGAHFKMAKSWVERNGGNGVKLLGKSHCEIIKCSFSENTGGLIEKEIGTSCTPCTGNVLVASKRGPNRTIPGFRLVSETGERVKEG